jgi:hypothetical protein
MEDMDHLAPLEAVAADLQDFVAVFGGEVNGVQREEKAAAGRNFLFAPEGFWVHGVFAAEFTYFWHRFLLSERAVIWLRF